MMRRDSREMTRVWVPRSSMREEAARTRSEAGCREGGTEAGQDFAKSTGVLAQLNGVVEGSLSQEPKA